MNDTLPISVGAPVRIRKLSACDNPILLSSSWLDWKIGEDNPASLPVAYELRGVLLAPIQVNEQINVLRLFRNGVRADGLFHSTTVCDLRGDSIALTFNSVYEIHLDIELASDLEDECNCQNGSRKGL